MRANTVKSALTSHHIVGHMNKLTHERSCIHVSIVIRALLSRSSVFKRREEIHWRDSSVKRKQYVQYFQLRHVPEPVTTHFF